MAKLLNEGVIQFRHPHVKDAAGYGRIIRRSICKLPQGRQGDIAEGIGKLLELKPLLRSEVEGLKLDEQALKIYFDPMIVKPETQEEFFARIKKALDEETPEEKQRKHDEHWAEAQKRGGSLDGGHMLSLLREAQQKNAEQEATIVALRKQIGERSEVEKGITLWDCLFWAWFRLPTREGAQNTGRLTLLRRAGVVLDAIGLDRPYASVTQDDILRAVGDSGADSDFERYARKQAVKRVFSFLCRPEIKDGLGFNSNPAEDIIVGSIGALQRKKRQKGEIEILDPMPFINKLEPYERALAACFAFAGLRLAEAAGLVWNNIDFKAGLIHVRASDHYPELKNIHSYRDIRPFNDIWKPLRALKALRLDDVLLFPRRWLPTRIKRKRVQQTWFDSHNDDVKVIHLSAYFRTRLEEQTGLKFEEAARRFRRYWETTMKAKGLGYLLPAMSGHDPRVGDAHYTEWSTIVEASAGKIGSAG